MSSALAKEPVAPTAPRIMVLGVGGSGTQAVVRMCRQNPGLDAVVIDTDAKALEACGMKNVIQVGAAVTNGFSAGGDVELGRQSIEKDSSSIRNQLKRADLLVIVAGLGGGTGSGALPVIARIASEAQALTLSMVSMPFAFEGKPMARKAEEALKRLRTHSDAVIRIPNEMLVDRADSDLPAEQVFSRSQEVMQEGVESLVRMLSQNGVYGLDFACLQTMLRNCDGFCHFAGADATGDGRGKGVADAILGHRLLNKGKVLGSSAGAIVSLVGGPDLKLSEVECIMLRLQEKLPEDAWVNFGVIVESAYEGRLAAVVLAAEQWKEPLMDGAGRQMGFTFNRRLAAEQGELPLETTGKGRFTHVDPTIYDNQDLDVPTYVRRGIKLPR